MDILQAAKSLRPGSTWNLRGDVLEPVDAFTATLVPPTAQEITDEINKTRYVEDQKKNWPVLVGLMDALWKAMDANQLPRVVGFYDVIKDVKDQFPAPATKP